MSEIVAKLVAQIMPEDEQDISEVLQESGLMRPSLINPSFMHFNGFCILERATPCARAAIQHIDHESDLFGSDLAKMLRAKTEEVLGDADRPCSCNTEHQAYFERQDYCRHDIPMAGEAVVSDSEFIMLPLDPWQSRILVEVVDELGEVVRTDAYTQMLAMDLVLRQVAPMPLRKLFEHLLRSTEADYDVRERVDFIMDEANTSVLVGDLVPHYDMSQKFSCITYKIEDGTLRIEMDDDSALEEIQNKIWTIPHSRHCHGSTQIVSIAIFFFFFFTFVQYTVLEANFYGMYRLGLSTGLHIDAIYTIAFAR